MPAFHRSVAASGLLTSRLAAALAGLLCLFPVCSLLAQQTAVTPAPVLTPSPASTTAPVASPTPEDAPTITITPGAPDAATEAAYLAARTPRASVVLTATVGSTNAAIGKALNRARTQSVTNPEATLQPAVIGGVSTILSLSPVTASVPAAGTAGTSNVGASATTTTAPLAVVTLSYGSAWAGQPLLIRPLAGGTVSSVGGDGQLYADTSGLLLTLDTAGAATFGFQAPAAAKTYQVLTRLDNVPTTFTFLVPDGNE